MSGISESLKRFRCCPSCAGEELWITEAKGHYWRWIQCNACGWRSEMESIPEEERAASDAALDKAGVRQR